jgi:signal transduction histidine kinase
MNPPVSIALQSVTNHSSDDLSSVHQTPTMSRALNLALYTSSSSVPELPFEVSPDESCAWVTDFMSADVVFAMAQDLKEARENYPQSMLVCLRLEPHEPWPMDADEVITRGADYITRQDLWRRARHWRVRARLTHQLTASEQRVEALEVAGRALSELHDESDIFSRLVEVVAEQLRSDRVSILRVFAERGELQMIAARGIPPEVVARARPKIGEGIAGRCAEQAKPIFVSNHQRYRDQSGGQVSDQDALCGEGEQPMSLTVPILVKGEVVGVVNVTGRVNDLPYSVAEIAFLSALMSHAGYLMESARLIDRLQVLKAFSEKVINTLVDPLAVVDREGYLLKVNPQFTQVFGGHHHAHATLRDTIKDALSQDLDHELHTHLSRGEPLSFPNLRYGAYTFDGHLIPFDGDDLRMLIILHDVTERQTMGKQLLSAEKMASLGILAAGVAHEINNPLGFVKTNTKEAGRYFDDLFEIIDAWEAYRDQHNLGDQLSPLRVAREVGLEEVREDVPNLVRESLEGLERIQKITASLKSFAHPDTENTRQAQLSILVDNAMVITQSKWRHTLKIHHELPQHGPMSCIPSQLEQVFMNLIVNAAQAAKSQSTTSSMEISLEHIPSDDPRQVVIHFADQCGGIPEEVVERIFDPFFTTKDIGEGTGLGLHIAHNIIEGHGGRIKVISQPPVGTTFSITLPLGVKRGPLVIKQLSRFKA